VLVGGAGVFVGGTRVLVGATGVFVGGTGVLVGGTGVSVGGTSVLVAVTGVSVGGIRVSVGAAAVSVSASATSTWATRAVGETPIGSSNSEAAGPSLAGAAAGRGRLQASAARMVAASPAQTLLFIAFTP
jgi:hypothetical protein